MNKTQKPNWQQYRPSGAFPVPVPFLLESLIRLLAKYTAIQPLQSFGTHRAPFAGDNCLTNRGSDRGIEIEGIGKTTGNLIDANYFNKTF